MDITPSFVVNPETDINVIIASSQAKIADQGLTFNQAGLTFNQAGVMFGGLYNINQDVAPLFANDTASFISPSISAIIK